MPTLREVVYALAGVFRLARLDVSGLAFFDRSTAAAARSFAAALLVLPVYGILVVLQLGEDASLSWSFFTVEIIAYVWSWTVYPLVMDELSRFLGRSDRYPLFLSVYNWSSVVQVLVYLLAVGLDRTGLLPEAVGDALMFTASMAVLVYQWFVTRVALDVSNFTAVGLVLLDLLLSMLISNIADNMM